MPTQTHLHTLETSGLIWLAQAYPELEYLFKHALLQDAAYRSLVKQDRRHLHQVVGETLERLYPDRRQALAPLLAQHFDEAGDDRRALQYLALAGQDAARRYANPEALALLTRALALAEGAAPEDSMRIHEARGQIYEFLSQYDPALSDYDKALGMAKHTGGRQDECRIMTRMAWLYWLSGRGALAVEVAREAEVKARELDDQSIGLRAYMVVGLVAQAEGRLDEAYPRMRQSLAASRASRERALEGESLFYLGIEDNFMGRFGRAAACARKAFEVKRSLGDRVGEMLSLYLLGRAEAGRGHYDGALAALEAGRAVAEQTRNPFGQAMYANQRAWLSAELGDWQTAYDLDRVGLETARAAPIRPPEISTLINLLLDCVALGRYREAEAYLNDLQQWIGRPEFGFHAWRWQTRLGDARARLSLARAQHGDALRAVDDLTEWAARTHSRKYLARGRLLRGQIQFAQNELREAEASFAAARDLADTICHLPTRLQARRGLLRIQARAGNGMAADQLTAEISQLIEDLDRRLGHPDLRRSFERGLRREYQV